MANDERAFITKLLTRNLTSLCRNSLPAGVAIHIDALIGVTLSNNQVILVNVSKSLSSVDEDNNIDFEDIATKNAEHSSTANHQRWPETLSERPTSSAVKPDLEESPDSSLYVLDQDSQSQAVKTDWVEIDDDDCVVIKQEISDGYKIFNNDERHINEQEAEIVFLPEASVDGEDLGELPAEDVSGSYFDDESLSTQPAKRQKMTGRPLKFGVNQKFRVYPPRTRCRMPPQNNSRNIRCRMPSSLTDRDLGLDPTTVPPVTDDDDEASTVNPLVGISRRVFSCPFCGLYVRTRATLQDHIHGKHMEIYSFPCKACGESFRWRSTLSNHRRVCPMAGVVPENTQLI